MLTHERLEQLDGVVVLALDECLEATLDRLAQRRRLFLALAREPLLGQVDRLEQAFVRLLARGGRCLLGTHHLLANSAVVWLLVGRALKKDLGFLRAVQPEQCLAVPQQHLD